MSTQPILDTPENWDLASAGGDPIASGLYIAWARFLWPGGREDTGLSRFAVIR